MTCKWKVFCKQGDTCVAHEGYDVWKCTAFKDKEEPLTNEEWLKQCTTEQLAEWLTEVTEYCFECGLNINNNVLCPFGKCIDKEHDAVKWLKEKRNER